MSHFLPQKLSTLIIVKFPLCPNIFQPTICWRESITGFWEGAFDMLVKHEFPPTLSDVYKGRPSKEEVWRIIQWADGHLLEWFWYQMAISFSTASYLGSWVWQNDCLEWLLPWGSWRFTKSQAVFPDKVTGFLHHSLDFLDSESLE